MKNIEIVYINLSSELKCLINEANKLLIKRRKNDGCVLDIFEIDRIFTLKKFVIELCPINGLKV